MLGSGRHSRSDTKRAHSPDVLAALPRLGWRQLVRVGELGQLRDAAGAVLARYIVARAAAEVVRMELGKLVIDADWFGLGCQSTNAL